jgi:hypothetical protein
VTPLPPGATQIEFDPDWWRGGGRLRLLFPPSAAAEQVASGMGVLVTATEDDLTSALHEAMAGGRQAMSLHDSDDPT